MNQDPFKFIFGALLGVDFVILSRLIAVPDITIHLSVVSCILAVSIPFLAIGFLLISQDKLTQSPANKITIDEVLFILANLSIFASLISLSIVFWSINYIAGLLFIFSSITVSAFIYYLSPSKKK